MKDDYDVALTNAVVANLRRLYWYYEYLFLNDGFNNHDDLLDIGKEMAKIQACLDVLKIDTKHGVYNQYEYQMYQTSMTEEQAMELFGNRIKFMYLPDASDYDNLVDVLTPVAEDKLWLETHPNKEVK